MPNRPTILIEGNDRESGWKGNVRCPRQPQDEATKNFFCPVKDSCILPLILTRAATQRQAQEIMAKAIYPDCKDKRRFTFLTQPPQPVTDMPHPVMVDFVIKP